MKTKLFLIISIGAIFHSIPSSFAGSVHFGQTVWKSKCLVCHEQQKKGPMSAGEYAGIQWSRYVEKNRHKNQQTENLSQNERESLIDYLKKYAADSDSPEIGGIR